MFVLKKKKKERAQRNKGDIMTLIARVLSEFGFVFSSASDLNRVVKIFVLQICSVEIR